jgi:NAD+ synthase
MQRRPFSAQLLRIDCKQEVEKICAVLRERVLRRYKKKGLVVGISGGVDSSVVAALAVLACGKDKVLGVQMPERHSSPETLGFSQLIARHLGIESVHEDITGILEAAGCYQRQEEAIRLALPQYGPGWKSKLVLPSVVDTDQYRIFSIVAESPSGQHLEARLNLQAYLGVVAATNFKQRARKMLEYYYADKLNYAVAGTPNRLEYDQGFFVKLGDGAADVKPIAHLFKTQVYELANHLGLPEVIRKRPPTTDTYSMPQSQEEFYFSLPYEKMDLVLYGKDHSYTSEEIAPEVGLSSEQVQRVFRDIDGKRRVADYLHAAPVLAQTSEAVSTAALG